MSKLKTVFVGSKELGFTALQILLDTSGVDVSCVVTFDDTNDTRSHFEQIKNLAEQRQIPLRLIDTANIRQVNDDLSEVLANFCPGLTFVVGWYWKLRPEVLRLSAKGIYGVHSADLPRYKGAAPVVWALLRGEENIGVSFFKFAEELDKGDVYAKVFIQARDRYIGDVLSDIKASLAVLISEGIENVEKNSPIPIPADDGLYFLTRTPEDAHIDWKDTGEKINRFVRAQSDPYPGAYFFYNGEKFKVFESELVETEHTYVAVPGSIFALQESYLKVACGDGRLIKLSNFSKDSDKIDNLQDFISDRTVRLR